MNEVHPDFVHLFLGSHNTVEVDNILANSSQRFCRKQDVGNNWVFVLVMCKALGPLSCLKDSVLPIFQPAAVCQIVCDGKDRVMIRNTTNFG